MKKIETLKPWRYNHYFNNQIFIKADNKNIGESHDNYGKKVIEEILSKLIKKPNTKRILDLGCLEGHYSEIFCKFGFKEVVSVDLSDDHIKRANFILKEINQFDNSTVKKGNVLDKNFISSFGKFDVIFFHGLLYHLTSPIDIFETIDDLINDKNDFYLLLGHQFKMNRGSMIQKTPIAELKFRSFKKNFNGIFINPKDSSAYIGPSLRLNISALYQLLLSYDYKQMIAYDKHIPKNMIKNQRMNVQLILSKNDDNIIHRLNDNSYFGEKYYYKWKGTSVSNLKLDRNLFSKFLIFFYRVLNKLSNILVK